MAPDFYSGSAHKWLCGPKETGVLYVNARSQPKLWPTIYSAYPGSTGFSKTFESMGQRDEPAIQAFGDAIEFQGRVGRKAIQARSWELGQALVEGLRKIDGVKVWSHGDPQLSAPVVSFRPGSLNAGRLADVLFEKDGIICALRGGSDRGGLRFSPHFYNSHAEVERALAGVAREMKAGASG
jgi:isopenicillin-N epimerase